ncbi:hypothetical protein CEXT_213171 [Caerostris extrusa]|uniref:Uncharacterized protein n=1 Tax=Caerostris extrusa TaxID=172846 RepID=A0AAV4PVS6_CAEEX|nr:hypothetical protein CEXT_213171 [Caerostris extrusa]
MEGPMQMQETVKVVDCRRSLVTSDLIQHVEHDSNTSYSGFERSIASIAKNFANIAKFEADIAKLLFLSLLAITIWINHLQSRWILIAKGRAKKNAPTSDTDSKYYFSDVGDTGRQKVAIKQLRGVKTG